MVRVSTMAAMVFAACPVAVQSWAQSGLPQVIRPEAGQPLAGAVARLDAGGHYRVQALVNGAPLVLLFDTGASDVVLRAEDAPRLGIDPAALSYSIVANTANGKTHGAPVVIASLTVGGITRRNVAAVVSQPGRLSENLLGQSFLSRLGGYRQEGGRLMLMDVR